MKLELPSCQRCCCCVPLRLGILTFAYLNLLVTIFFAVLQITIWIIHHESPDYQAMYPPLYRGVVIETHIILGLILHLLDAVFNIVLIVGAHLKKSKLMRWYYYYQLTTMIANFVAMLVTYTDLHKFSGWRARSSVLEIAVAFIGFVIQIYLLLLVHSELKKQRYKEGRSSYVNQMGEVFIEPSNRRDRRTLL